jgi:hypothetical protein
MRKSIKITIAFLCAMFYQGSFAQETTHWTCSPNDFQYDMTAYIALTNDGVAVTDYSDYEVAAFCGDECRGVGEVQTVGTTSYIYMRIRSNAASGEDITFKVYTKSDDIEADVEEYTMPFVSQGVQGMPSSPVVLNFVPYIPGDPSGDKEIDVFDIVAIMDYVLEGNADDFNAKAADFNGDGEVDIFDIVELMDYILNQ